MSTIAAADLGGTKVRVAILDPDGAILGSDRAPTDPGGAVAVAAQIGAMIRALARTTGTSPAQAVIGVPGVPDAAAGRVLHAQNIPGMDRTDVAGLIAQATGAVVRMENDVNLAALGEWRARQARGVRDMVLVALGTGIGAGIVADGRLLRGATGAAGEVAWLPFGADPFEPESLRAGAFERAVGTHGLAAAWTAAQGAPGDVPGLFATAAAGDPAAAAIIADLGRMLARGAAALGAVLGTDLVVLGGSIGARPEVVAATAAALPLILPMTMRVEAGLLGPDAPFSGAVALVAGDG